MTEFSKHPQASGAKDGGGSTNDLVVPAAPAGRSPHGKEALKESRERRCSLSPLATAIVKTFDQPDFSPVLNKLLSQGGGQGVQRMWAVAQEILDRGPDHRRTVAWVIASEISKFCGTHQMVSGVLPSLDVVARFLNSESGHSFSKLKFFVKAFPIDHLDLVLRRDVLRYASGDFLWSYLKNYYHELIQRPDKRESLGSLLRATALRRDYTGLEMCRYIRDRYEAVRGWIGKEPEAALLWKVRDDLTKKLCESPLACERNLKLALLFPKSVPHPCLDNDAQRLLECESWIVDCHLMLEDAYGWEQCERIVRESAAGTLVSASFTSLPAPVSAPVRGLQVGQSKFDMDSHILFPLYNFLGIARDGEPRAAHEVPVRSWLSRGDEVRCQKARVLAAFKTLSEFYWAAECPDRVREKGRELLRAVVREHPYAVAEAAFAARKFSGYFVGDLLRIVREEALEVVRSYSGSEVSSRRLRESFVVAAAFGISTGEINAAAMRELERTLEVTGQKELSEYDANAFLSATRMTYSITPRLEARGLSLIRDYPDTLGASLLARALFEVRCADPSIMTLARAQALSGKLNAMAWLNYAHAAIGFGLDPHEQRALREVFTRRYEGSVRGFSRWCPRSRASLRLILASLSPEVIGEVRVFNGYNQGLFRSPLEARVLKRIEQMSGVTVAHDVYLPWAPAVDAVVFFEGAPRRPIVVLVDGESYHAVNGDWMFRGFDGHSVLVTRILTRAGYPVVRIAAQFGESALEFALSEAFSSIGRYVVSGELPKADRLVVDPPESFNDIGGKVILYNSVGAPRELTPLETHGSTSEGALSDLEPHVEERGDQNETL